MEPKCFATSTQFHDNAHLNRYRKVGVHPDGADGHRVTYEGACFICGAPITVHKLWQCTPDNIPDMIRDRFLCGEHG
jgi:hypothetical protein